MKICIIGPGLMPIPPIGWGAVETVIDGYSRTLKAKGWDVTIVNTTDKEAALRSIRSIGPDIVHCHYDQYASMMKEVSCKVKIITPHYGYASQVWIDELYYNKVHMEIAKQKDLYIFALSPEISRAYQSSGVDVSRIYHLPNGNDVDSFSFTEAPMLGERTLCLGKIEPRKRQGFLQLTNSLIDFVGDIGDADSGRFPFNIKSRSYLGGWTRKVVKENMTNYGNLVLLSDGEAHPLVCIEALSAGLGLVVSSSACANLDLDCPFISLVPDERSFDLSFIERTVEENRRVSLASRHEIRNYAKDFSWDRIVERYIHLTREISVSRSVPIDIGAAGNRRKVAIVTIATGDYYDAFFSDFCQSVREKWAGEVLLEIFCFTDRLGEAQGSEVHFIETKKLGWPFDSLMRFHYLHSIKERLVGFDNVIFMDSDMVVVGQLDLSILDYDFFAVEHPGYIESSWAPFEVDASSLAFSSETTDRSYVQGCFFGGRAAPFGYMVSRLNSRVWDDLSRFVVPVWHDESYLNWFASTHPVVRVSTAYAAPEGWEIGVQPIVIHRSKNATKLRGVEQEQEDLFSVIMLGDQASRWKFYRQLGFEAHGKNQRLVDYISQINYETNNFYGLSRFAARYLRKVLSKFFFIRLFWRLLR